VLAVDKLENNPGALEVFGITEVPDVAWIVRLALTPAKALDPTLKLAGVDVYPRLIVARAEQVLNALAPIIVTLLGIVIVVSEVHDSNALAPIIVTLLGIVIVVSEVHDSNALAPMLVTLFGIVTVVSLLHPLNVFALMLVTLLVIIMLVRPVQS